MTLRAFLAGVRRIDIYHGHPGPHGLVPDGGAELGERPGERDTDHECEYSLMAAQEPYASFAAWASTTAVGSSKSPPPPIAARFIEENEANVGP